MANVIKDMKELKKKISAMKKNDRLDRHASVEIALAGKHKEVELLQKEIKRLTEENAGLRYDVSKYEKLFEGQIDE